MGDTKRGRERKGADKEAQTERFLIERAVERHESDEEPAERASRDDLDDVDT